MDPRTRLQLLKYMDVSLWERRNAFLFFDKPLPFARLAIVLEKPLNRQVSEEKKVLSGMLSVLNLKKEEYWLGWVLPETKLLSKAGVDAFWQAMQTWLPNAILLLGEGLIEQLRLPSLETFETVSKKAGEGSNENETKMGSKKLQNDNHYYIGATFHPEELIKMPEKKKQAYQSLLNLKKELMSVNAL